MNRIGNFVDGKQIEGLSNKEQSVFDPSKGEECNKVILSNYQAHLYFLKLLILRNHLHDNLR